VRAASHWGSSPRHSAGRTPGALIQRACGVILAVTPDPAAFDRELAAAQAALDGPVIIHSSAIAVATVLADRWSQLRGAFTEVRLPRDAWADFQSAHEQLLRDPDSTFSVGYDAQHQVLVSHQLSEADHQYLTCRFAAIDRAIRDLTLVATPELGAFADCTPATTDAALSPLAAAAETGTPLWSDDTVIRAIAGEQGVSALGTLALLDVLIDADRLPDTAPPGPPPPRPPRPTSGPDWRRRGPGRSGPAKVVGVDPRHQPPAFGQPGPGIRRG
jgi:hypothetical protein